MRAAVSTFARFDSDRPWAAFDAATADELDAMARLGGLLCLSELLGYECRRQETAMGSEPVVEWPRRVRLRKVDLREIDVAPGMVRVRSQQKSSFRGDLHDGPVRPL